MTSQSGQKGQFEWARPGTYQVRLWGKAQKERPLIENFQWRASVYTVERHHCMT